ncbi:hypothetical protein MUU47_00185 [Scandinavium sp. H11S7]|uniref:Secreted protein n=1 Tax=Scandinavium hiltneri TaxID=2926519 RepID=A0ABT2DVD8_9ENTR|nr:hypothetical protein [Scandinavium hiltneri]MCS2159594.1 hypothetical protein [Scandinavium hiltneri]
MKKISLILLITIYSLSTLGIGVKQFYCCGKLKSTDVSFVQKDTKDNCSKGSMGGCCKTKFQSLKVKDSHVGADATATPVKHLTDLHLFTTAFEMPLLASKPLDIANATHAPPLHHGVPIYILNCVYRI